MGPDTSFLKSGKTDRKIPIFVSGGSHIFVLPEISDSDLRHFFDEKKAEAGVPINFFRSETRAVQFAGLAPPIDKIVEIILFFRNKNVF